MQIKRARHLEVGDWIDPTQGQPPVADLENGPSPDDVDDGKARCMIEQINICKVDRMVYCYMMTDANPPLDPDYSGPMIDPQPYLIGQFRISEEVKTWTSEEVYDEDEEQFLSYVRHQLIPDLVESGQIETAKDFDRLIQIIDRRATQDIKPDRLPRAGAVCPDREDDIEELSYHDGTHPA